MNTKQRIAQQHKDRFDQASIANAARQIAYRKEATPVTDAAFIWADCEREKQYSEVMLWKEYL